MIREPMRLKLHSSVLVVTKEARGGGGVGGEGGYECVDREEDVAVDHCRPVSRDVGEKGGPPHSS